MSETKQVNIDRLTAGHPTCVPQSRTSRFNAKHRADTHEYITGRNIPYDNINTYQHLHNGDLDRAKIKTMCFVSQLTSLAVYFLGSPVEIHLAGGERVSVRLRRGGRSGGMLTAQRRSGKTLLRTRPAVAASVAAASAAGRSLFFISCSAEVMLWRPRLQPVSSQTHW